MPAGLFGFDDLAAHGRGRFFPAALVRAKRPVHVVVARDAADETVVLFKVPAHALGEELLPTVAILGQRRIGILFLQGDDVRIGLLFAVVHASGGGKEEALDARFPRGHQHVRVRQHTQHAKSLVVFDKAHAAHVRGKLKNDIRVVGSGLAVRAVAQIERKVLNPLGGLVPLVQRLDIHSTNDIDALREQILNQMPTDEATRAAHHYLFIFQLHLLAPSATPAVAVPRCRPDLRTDLPSRP